MDATQSEVYESTAKPIIKSLLKYLIYKKNH